MSDNNINYRKASGNDLYTLIYFDISIKYCYVKGWPICVNCNLMQPIDSIIVKRPQRQL